MPAIREALATYDRLQEGRGETKRAMEDARKALDTAALRDRRDLADAMAAGTKRPKSDAHESRANDALREAHRQSDAAREAYAIGARKLIETLQEHGAEQVAALDEEITTAQAAALQAVRQVAETLDLLADLRAPRQFVVSEGSRSTSPRPEGATVDQTLERLQVLIGA